METLRKLLTLPFVFCACFLGAQTIYVSPTGTGSGTSWSAASSLQSALAAADAGDELWLAAGTYRPTTCGICSGTQRAISFDIPSGVRVLGGFFGNETDADDRNPQQNLTVLSGNIDNADSSDQNAYNVLFFDHVNAETLLDGLIIRDGNADFGDGISPQSRGGAAYIDGSSSMSGSNPRFVDCIFENNQASNQGGAVFCDGLFGATAPVFTRCTFQNNGGDLGGAVFIDGKEGDVNPEFRRCIFTQNTAEATGGAVYTFTREDNGTANTLFISCLFSENEAANAGAVYSLGVAEGTVVTEVINSAFIDNFANLGGAVYVNASNDGNCDTYLRNCILWGNDAAFDDVFHYSGDAQPVIHLQNVIVDKNNCDDLLLGPGDIDCQSNVLYNQNPLFVNAAAKDYRLTAASPAVNFGNNTFLNGTGENADLDGDVRVQSGNVDLGPFEFGGNTVLPLQITQQPQTQVGCESLEVTFTVSATGTQPLTYQWRKNNQNIGGQTDNSLLISNLNDADIAAYRCVVTDALGENITTAPAQLTLTELVFPTVDILHDGLEICAGEDITFTAQTSNGGNPFLIWAVNGEQLSNENGQQFTLENPADGTEVRLDMVSSMMCAVPEFVQSDPVTVSVVEASPVALSAAADATEVCAGDTVEFTSEITGDTENVSYSWRVNGTEAGTNADFSSAFFSAQSEVQLTTTITPGCGDEVTLQSEIFTIIAAEVSAPQIDISATATTVCAGDVVTFTADGQNVGSGANYAWFVNGNAAASGSTFTTSSLNDGDAVTCTVTSALTCSTAPTATSEAIVITLSDSVVPSIFITADVTEICAGDDVIFTASIENGGANPGITWFINEIPLANNALSLSLPNVLQNTEVYAVLNSAAACATTDTNFSQTVNLTPTPALTPTVTLAIDKSEFCANSEKDFAFFTAETGFPAAQYLWFLNGTEIQNGTENTLTLLLSEFNDGDAVTCQTVSEGECLTATTVTSEPEILAIFPAPEVSLLPFDTLCLDAGAVTLTGGMPEGGAYGGAFVGSGAFNATQAGVGIYPITYVFTDENNCMNSATADLAVEVCSAVADPADIALRVFPNPFTETLEVRAEGITGVRLLTSDGKEVYNREMSPTDFVRLSVGEVIAGRYFLEVILGEGRVIRGVVRL